METARMIADAAPLAVRATKAAVRRGLGITPDAIRDAAHAEAHAQAATLATDDCREGIAALLGKRTPVFTGR
jgi:2-(1,2-epoxy-1,2-dihydrophenyl)acetyl-CoA isomerase